MSTNPKSSFACNSRSPRLLAGVAGIALLYAGYWEGIEAYSSHISADRSPDGLLSAAALTPGNADLWRDQAVKAMETDPVAAAVLFQRAIDLNPSDARARVGLGLLAESAGRLREAEVHLRAAAESTQRIRPQLALVDFYARRGQLDDFWRAANRAAAIERADLKPLFTVAHAIVTDPAEVAASLQLTTRHANASYAQFLLDRREHASIAAVALRLEPPEANRPLLLAITNRLIDQARIADAIKLWNRLYPDSLDPVAGRSIVNSNFAPGDGAGFDWRHTPCYGIDLRRAPADLRIEFSGRQPENAVLLEQFVPVQPGRTYRLAWKGYMYGAGLRPGLCWQLGRQRRAVIPATADASGSEDFQTAPGETSIRLALHYNRPIGITRLEGAISLQSVELKRR